MTLHVCVLMPLVSIPSYCMAATVLPLTHSASGSVGERLIFVVLTSNMKAP